MGSSPRPTPPDQRDRQAAYRSRPRTPLHVHPLQRAIIWGTITDDAIAQRATLDNTWLNLVTADKGTWDRNRAQLFALEKTGIVDIWCDCRVDGGTHPQVAIDLARDIGMQWVGQAETSAELEWAVGIAPGGGMVAPAGTERAKRIVANPNAWTPQQRETANRMIEAADLSVSGEQYAGPDAMVSYSAGGVDIDSVTLGVAMDGDLYYDLGETLAELEKRPDGDKFLSTVLLWHGGGLRPESWEAARAL